MLKNYFKIAWRTITRHKVFSIINVVGLALGICACIVIYLITSYELGFDTFHPGKERIYRIMTDVKENNGEKSHFATIPFPALAIAERELSGLDAIAGISVFNAKIDVPNGDAAGKQFDSKTEGSGYSCAAFTQPSWFTIFKYEWLAGNVASEPYTVVLAETKARKYFGNEALDRIIGKEVVYNDSIRVRVSGIVKDWKSNTDFAFTDFISFSTFQSGSMKNVINQASWKPNGTLLLTFAKLSNGTTPASVNEQMSTLTKMHAETGIKLALWLEPLSGIHFNSNVVENAIRTAHMPTLYSLMGIALFILIIATINFVNLSTAQSIQRIKEIGVRKVLGSSRMNLILQFFIETLLLNFFALLLAVVMVNSALSAFRTFIPSGIVFDLSSSSTVFFLVIVTLVTSLLAGFYPAKLLSSYLPVLSLKGTSIQKGSERWYLRKALIVFQFTVSLVFIIGSIVIGRQLSYTRNKDLGFTADAIITVGTPFGDSLSKIRVVAQKIKQIPGISRVALQWGSPGAAKGMNIKFKSRDEKETRVAQVDGDENLIPLYQLKLLAGRNLSHSDSVKEFIINEKLSRLMGYKTPVDAIGQTIYWFDKPFPVVGVVADFNSSSLHDPIIPLCIINRVEREGTLAIKLDTKGKEANTLHTSVAQIEKIWKSIYPAATFDYQFYDESLAMKYEKDKNTATLVNTAMFITIFISCMGLFGLGMFTANRKTKEIGIRKVLGASIADILIILSSDFIRLIVIAMVIASPVAWYFMNQWLQNFAYRVNTSWWIFALAGLSALLIAALTVSFHSIKAAITNPVKSLRTE